MVERKALNLVVVGSSPTVGVSHCFTSVASERETERERGERGERRREEGAGEGERERGRRRRRRRGRRGEGRERGRGRGFPDRHILVACATNPGVTVRART